MIRWVEKHKGTPGTRSDYRQIDGWWLGTLCRISDLAPSGRWHWTVFTDNERGPTGTADDEQGAKDACKAALARLLAEDEGLRALLGSMGDVRALDRARNAEERIAELEAAQRWIPVGERLPDSHRYSLAWDGDGMVFATVDSLGQWWSFTRRLPTPEFWRPLPAGPEAPSEQPARDLGPMFEDLGPLDFGSDK